MVAVRPTFPPAGAARQAGRQHRPHQRRPAVAQRRVVLVGGRGEEVRRRTSSGTTTATPAPPSGSRWSTASGPPIASPFSGRFYRVDEQRAASRSRCRGPAPCSTPAASPRPQRAHRQPLRRLPDARRPPGAGRRQGGRHGRAPASGSACRRSASASPATSWCATRSARPAPSWPASPTCSRAPPASPTYQQWLAGTQLEQKMSTRGLLGIESRPARGPGRHARAGARADRGARFEEAGGDLMLLQFSPQLEEMERFSCAVIQTTKSRFEPSSLRRPLGADFLGVAR